MSESEENINNKELNKENNANNYENNCCGEGSCSSVCSCCGNDCCCKKEKIKNHSESENSKTNNLKVNSSAVAKGSSGGGKNDGIKSNIFSIFLMFCSASLLVSCLFFLIYLLIWSDIFKSESDYNVVSLNLNGVVVESKTESIFMDYGLIPDNGEIALYDIVRTIEYAKYDKRIEGIYLNVDGMSAGWANTKEIHDALVDFKKSGKKVISYSENIDQKQFLLVSTSHFSALHPSGAVMVNGISRSRQYYGSLLKNTLGLDIHLFKAGQFKSAAEPYILDGASEQAKTADMFWISDIWGRYLSDVSKSKKWEDGRFKSDVKNTVKNVTENNGSFAEMALSLGWVSVLADRFEFENQENGLPYEFGKNSKQIDMVSYLEEVSDIDKRESGVALVIAEGEISVTGEPGTMSGDDVSMAIDDAVADGYRAIVLRVNSPGGAVFPSEKIRDAVLRAKDSDVVVVASMADMAASGGYMISMDADTIIANESTVTGSIGVFGILPNANRALSKIGVYSDGVATEDLANSFDPTQPMPEKLPVLIQSVINGTYKSFTDNVSKARGIPVEKVHDLAQGRVWTGSQALKSGLVDMNGGILKAIEQAAILSKQNPKKVKAEIIQVGYGSESIFDLFSASIYAGKNKNTLEGSAYSIIKKIENDPVAKAAVRSMADGDSSFSVMVNCLCEIE